jgi:AMP nucleosidase
MTMQSFSDPSHATDLHTRVDEIINDLNRLYQEAVASLTHALEAFIRHGQIPDPALRQSGAFCYPQLVLDYHPEGPVPPESRAFGKFSEAGRYAVSVTRPDHFAPYLREQLTMILGRYPVGITVQRSDSEIPYAYVWDNVPKDGTDSSIAADLSRHFPSPKLTNIGDEIADGELFPEFGDKPLALFDAQRVDFSLKRLQHYTGTPAEHVQPYILFTNYNRYVDAFCEWAVQRVQDDSPYDRLSVAGNIVVDAHTPNALKVIQDGPWRRHQMPAYHLMRRDGTPGITLVNIGVGPSNAKTITDHLAVLRPQCWIMVGHCGGLRHSQKIGDYVLAHAYLRDDHVLDAVLPPDIPVPPIAEVQVALHAAAEAVTGQSGEELKARLRTGTVVTTDDRNWELRYTASARRFNQSRAVAIDMESATIAANGYRLRVPYGVLLCVSDKPLHGEIKLPGAANRFYERAIGEHIRIGIETLETLARDGGARLHSRKLRAFDEPPFR